LSGQFIPFLVIAAIYVGGIAWSAYDYHRDPSPTNQAFLAASFIPGGGTLSTGSKVVGKAAAAQLTKKAVKEAAKQQVKKDVARGALKKVADLGYKKTKQLPKALNSKGNPVYTNPKAPNNVRYISPDKTRHTGSNQYKGFDSRGNRTGTYKIKNGKLTRIRG
jgi:hypothetical protein